MFSSQSNRRQPQPGSELFFESDLEFIRSFSFLGKIVSHVSKICLVDGRLCVFMTPTLSLKQNRPPPPFSISFLVDLLVSPEVCWKLYLDDGASSGWITCHVFLSTSLSTSCDEDLASANSQPILSISSVLGRTRWWVMISGWAWPNKASILVLIFCKPLLSPLRFKGLVPSYLGEVITWAFEKYLYLLGPVRAPTKCIYCSCHLCFPSPVPLILIITFLMLFKIGCCTVLCFQEKIACLYFSSLYEEDLSPLSSLWERSFISSSVKERILPPLCSLWMRIVSCPVVKPRMLIPLLTDLVSYAEILSRSEDAVGIVSWIPIGLDPFSKSHYADDAVTTLQLTFIIVVRAEILLAPRSFKPSDLLVNTLSNSYQFVSLSHCCISFIALISAVWLASRIVSDNAHIFVIA